MVARWHLARATSSLSAVSPFGTTILNTFDNRLKFFFYNFSSFFVSYDAMNEYRGDRNVARKLLTVDGNDNFRRLPSP